MKCELKRDVQIRETGLVIWPNLFLVAASPDGLISDKFVGVGLIEIKCPKSKLSYLPEDLMKDDKFYVQQEDGKLTLKKIHEYYTQVQMAMGISGALFCDFVVYTLKGLIITRTAFDDDYFISVMKKINTFYRMYMLPKFLLASDARR